MKISRILHFASISGFLVAASAEGQTFESMGFGKSTSWTVLVVKPDGSSVLTNDTEMSRKTLEMQVAAYERYSKAGGNDSEDEDSEPGLGAAPKPEQKPLTDDQLASRIREMYEERENSDEESGMKVDRVDISTNKVRLTTTRAYASLKELFSENPYTWGPNVLMFQEARAELDTNRNLRITLTTSAEYARYIKATSRAWKSSGMKYEWKVALPGKILTSGLPNTQANATWLSLDAEKQDSLDAAIKLLGQPLVITAEPGGIMLPEPLDSKKLVQAAYRKRKSEPDLPVTDAGPGFLAEPVSISLSTVYHFPEGEKYLKGRPEAAMFGYAPTGAVVSAKLFPPKGREIQSVSGLRVKEAKDDKGRAIPGIGEGGEDEEGVRGFSSYSSFSRGDSENSSGRSIELRLGLPAPDAKAINELQAEAVAVTIGSWKEMVLTNVQADTKNQIDLGEVCPGAKMIIKKITGKNQQRTVQATLQGSASVNQLEVKIKLAGRRNGQSNMSDVRTKTSGDKTTRTISLQTYEFEPADGGKAEPLTLVVRFPQDMKRERVQFKLTALDLL